MSKNVGAAGYGEAFGMHNRRNSQVKMRQLFFYSSLDSDNWFKALIEYEDEQRQQL